MEPSFVMPSVGSPALWFTKRAYAVASATRAERLSPPTCTRLATLRMSTGASFVGSGTCCAPGAVQPTTRSARAASAPRRRKLMPPGARLGALEASEGGSLPAGPVDRGQRFELREERGPFGEGRDERRAARAVLGRAGRLRALLDAGVDERDPGAAVGVHLHVDEAVEAGAAAGAAVAAHERVVRGVDAQRGDAGLLARGVRDHGEVGVPRHVVERRFVVVLDLRRVGR